MAKCSFAEWWGPVPNKSSGVRRPARGVILHVIVGTLQAANSVFHNPSRQASSHFGVGKDGRVVQWVDTSEKAWTEGAGNPDWISIETEGQPSEALTPQQIESCARVYAWAAAHEGPFPFVVTDSPQGHGFGTHSMGGSAWGGHACPGAIRAGQREKILVRAREIAGTAAGTAEEQLKLAITPERFDQMYTWLEAIFGAEGRADNQLIDTLSERMQKNVQDAVAALQDAPVNSHVEEQLAELKKSVDALAAKMQ